MNKKSIENSTLLSRSGYEFDRIGGCRTSPRHTLAIHTHERDRLKDGLLVLSQLAIRPIASRLFASEKKKLSREPFHPLNIQAARLGLPSSIRVPISSDETRSRGVRKRLFDELCTS